MLIGLNISNIVLIERLNLEFGAGLNILTGETGAGKSILLDALSLALGARSDVGLVRHGCDMASVIAEFDDADENLRSVLNENGIDYDGQIILRRTLSADGKSRAWVNDVPVSIKTLKQVGDMLVEIHGQFANHTLLNPLTHRQTLDEYATRNVSGFGDLLNAVRCAYDNYHRAVVRLNELNDILSRAESEREYLEHNVAELRALNPTVGEEEKLATQRTAMMNAERDAGILNDTLGELSPNGTQSVESQIFAAAHTLEHIKSDPNPYQAQIDKLYDAGQMIAEVTQALAPSEIDITSLDSIEERLFAIRAAARKHRVSADELPQKLQDMIAQLNAIDNSDQELRCAKSDMEKYRQEYDMVAQKLSVARTAASEKLRSDILRELPDLKLGTADFMVEFAKTAPSVNGTDDIVFMIKTNPGMPFVPLHKSASGGELARLMLALRVVLASDCHAHTFVFDEVDTGISGATASAVGLRLNKLAQNSQALVITHSAQVAGFADRHFKIEKNVSDGTTTTSVYEITGDARVNEIARIISGAEITNESIATAKTLMK